MSVEVHGTLVKQGIIHRQKKYKDDNGKVIFEGRQEAYAVRHPRDYKKNPPQGEELQNINIFTEANRLTTKLIHLDHQLNAAQLSNNPVATPPSHSPRPHNGRKSKTTPRLQTPLQEANPQARPTRPDRP